MIPTDRVPHATGTGFPSIRAIRCAKRAISRYELDLSDLVVLTEAATGYYRLTAVIAAMAGAAEVIAVARNSVFGTAEQARRQVEDLASTAGVAARINLTATPAIEVAHRAQVITNLGAVRPIDCEFVDRLSQNSAVSLMFGSKDARPADLDIGALRAAGVPLCGVDEVAIDLFRWTGQRIAWWLTEVGLELVGSRLLVWGNSPPAVATARWLENAGCSVMRRSPPSREGLAGIDGIILMDASARIEPGGALPPQVIAESAPGAAILEYAGHADREGCAALGLLLYPLTPAINGHVARTIGEILYAPVIELHTAGLRVGEIMARARLRGEEPSACEGLACDEGPGEALPDH